MPETSRISKRRSRLQLDPDHCMLFGGPLLLAAVLYQTGAWQPAGRTNNGAMLQPIVNLNVTLPGDELAGLLADSWLADLCVNDGDM